MLLRSWQGTERASTQYRRKLSGRGMRSEDAMTNDDAPGAAAGDDSAGKPAKWQRARPPSLTPADSGDDALATIILSGVEHLRGNDACVLARAHEEGVHQMRVAARRLRSALALFKGYIPPEQRDHLNGELRWLIGELGPARDWDVFVADILSPVLAQLPDEGRLHELCEVVAAHRDDAYQRAQTALQDRRYAGVLLLLQAWADGRSWREGAAPAQSEPMQQSIIGIASRLLAERHDQAVTDGEDFAALDAEQRHRVRIQIKKLRYASDFFASLYDKHRVEPYMAVLKELQDDLGSGNDVAVARTLLKRARKGLTKAARTRIHYAAGLVVGWHSHVSDKRETRLLQTWEHFTTLPAYWDAAQPGDAGTALAAGAGAAAGEASEASGAAAVPPAVVASLSLGASGGS
jgi:CHAD domain-containing protein